MQNPLAVWHDLRQHGGSRSGAELACVAVLKALAEQAIGSYTVGFEDNSFVVLQPSMGIVCPRVIGQPFRFSQSGARELEFRV